MPLHSRGRVVTSGGACKLLRMRPLALPARAVICGAATLVVTACAREAPADGVTRAVRGDTTFVSSPLRGVRGPVTLVEAVRLRSDSAELNRVSAGAFGPDGSIWLFDDAAREGASLYLFDSAGVLQRQVGREGSGPGEYRAPLRIFALAGSVMLVKEMSTTRALRLAANGDVLATLALPPSVATGWVVTPDTLGGWFITASFEDNRPEKIGRFGWLHFDSTGIVRDTARPPAAFLNEETPDGIAPGRIRTVDRHGAVLTTVPGPNRVWRYHASGAIDVMQWPGEPVAYGADERADLQVAEDAMRKLFGLGPRALPERKEPAHRILTDRSGFVWAHLAGIGVRIPDDELPKGQGPLTIKWRDRERWAAFSSDGVLQFIVEPPVGARLLDRDGTRILGMIADADGAEHAVVWDVVSTAPPRRP